MLRLAAEHLLPGEGRDIELRPVDRLREHGRGRVANGQSLAVGGNPIGVRHAHARGGSVPGEHHVAVEIDLAQIRQVAVRCEQSARVGQLELLDDVDDPFAAERFPGEHVDAARPEQRPERHLDRARVRRRHDGHAIIGGKLEQLTRSRERKREPLLRLGLAVVAAEQRAAEPVERPARMLGAGPAREARIVRAHCRLRHDRHHAPPLIFRGPTPVKRLALARGR